MTGWNPDQTVTLPDVEAAIIGALDVLGVPVASEWPRDLPERWVVVTATGGDMRRVTLAEPLVLVECFGPSTVESSALARAAHARLSNAALGWPGVDVGRVQASLPTNYPDPRTRAARHQFTVSAVISMEVT